MEYNESKTMLLDFLTELKISLMGKTSPLYSIKFYHKFIYFQFEQ